MPIYGRTCYSHPSYIYHEALGCVYMWRLHALRREVRSARARSAELEAQMADPALPLALALALALPLALPLPLPLTLTRCARSASGRRSSSTQAAEVVSSKW